MAKTLESENLETNICLRSDLQHEFANYQRWEMHRVVEAALTEVVSIPIMLVVRRGSQSKYDHAQCYASLDRPKLETSDVVITSIISTCHQSATVLFNPDSNYFYVSIYFASTLKMFCQSLVLLCTYLGIT